MMKRLLQIVAGVLVVALAYMHWILPQQVERGINVNIEHDPYVISDEAQALHDSLFIADLHTDSLLWKRDLTKRSATGHMDLPRMQDGNLTLQVYSATTKSPDGQNYESNDADSDQITTLAMSSFWPPRTWSSLYERAAYQLEKLTDLAAKSEVVLILSSGDLQSLVAARARGERLIGAVYLIEGAHPLEGDVDNLDRLFEQGLRIVGLTHFFDNELGGSLHGIEGSGLTQFGREVIQRANKLGMIIDVAHSSPAMVEDVLELSTSPLIVSHTGLQGACDTPRNISDELMLKITAAGGLIGIGFWDAAVCDPTPQGVVRSIRYAIDLLGVDHVALGSDYDGATAVTFDVSELAVLTQIMLEQDFTEQEIRQVMGENIKRFMLRELPGG